MDLFKMKTCSKGKTNKRGNINCKINNKSEIRYQQIGGRSFNQNMTLFKLKKELKDNDEPIYYYIIKSVVFSNGEYHQSGCGPNFEGGVITLCTCKHRMRTFPEINKGTWVAGITTRNSKESNINNSLFYIAQIKKVYDDYDSLISELPKNVVEYKSSLENPLGDIFFPKSNCNNLHLVDCYISPIKDHVHIINGNSWQEDVGLYKSNKIDPIVHKLIVFDKSKSFIWKKPIITYQNNSNFGVGQAKTTVSKFLNNLLQTY